MDAGLANRAPELSIVIVGYRSRDDLPACLSGLQAQLDGIRAEVIVADNASGDGTVAMLEERFPSVITIALEENIGFARAVNLAAERATGEFLLLLNPDTQVQPDAPGALLRFARQRPEYGIYGGRTLTTEGELEPSSCWGRATLWSTFLFASGATTAFPGTFLDPESIPGWERDSVREVGVVTGCLLLVRADIWRQLGGFDRDFFMYGEDADLAERARARGWSPVITPEAAVEHQVGASSSFHGGKNVMLLKGRVTLMRKHWSPLRRDLGIALLLFGTALRATVASVNGGDKTRPGQPSSWRHALRHRCEWRDGWTRAPSSMDEQRWNSP